jgi:DNA-binding CsgD family transcriptional regulator
MSDSDEVIHEHDVRSMVRLIGNVAQLNGSISRKKRALMNGLGALVEADAWSWIVSRASTRNDNAAVASFMYEGLSEEQFTQYVRIMQDRTNTPVEYKALNDLRLTHKRFTRSWDQLVTPEQWYGPANRSILDAVGFEHVVYSVQVLDNDGLFSGIALKRRLGRENFSPRQRRMVHVVTGEVSWLHHDDKLASVSHKIRPLPPRLRMVLTLLVDGNSVPQIAKRLNRSPHTIHDYTKEIYQHFAVKTRAGLLRHFISGDGNDVTDAPG